MIQAAGIAPQIERRDPYKVTGPIELKELGESEMVLLPDEGFKITCTSSDKQARFTAVFHP